MCLKYRGFWLSLLFSVCLILFARQAAQAQERWFLISETELQSIEQYKQNREQERLSWLSQVRVLKQDSQSLNDQLARAMEQNRKLEALFNKSENEKLMLLSSKNGEIEKLKQEAAQMERIAADEKIKSQRRLFIIVLSVLLNAIICVLLIYRFIKRK